MVVRRNDYVLGVFVAVDALSAPGENVGQVLNSCDPTLPSMLTSKRTLIHLANECGANHCNSEILTLENCHELYLDGSKTIEGRKVEE